MFNVYSINWQLLFQTSCCNSQCRCHEGNIEATQLVAVSNLLAQKPKPRTPNPPSSITVNVTDDTDASNCKRSTASLSSPVSNSYSSQLGPTLKKAKNTRQPLIWSGTPNPIAPANMDIAVVDMIHSNNLSFTFARDAKILRCFKLARTLPSDYNTPDRNALGGQLLQTLYKINWTEAIAMLIVDCVLFGLTLIGDGATTKTTPMINALAAGVNNPFALLDVFDCSKHCSKGGKKDASYIAKLFLPLIQKLESTTDKNVRLLAQFVQPCVFDCIH